jgi:hypothetical protein
MVVHNFHIKRPWGSLRPFKANPPLVIDADAVLASAITLEAFQPVSRGIERHETIRSVQSFKPQHGLFLKPLKGFYSLSRKKSLGFPTAEIYNHQ